MNCEQSMQELTLYLDRELSEAEILEVRQHLDECPPCRHCYEFQAELKRLVRKECASEGAPDRLRLWVRRLLVGDPPSPRRR